MTNEAGPNEAVAYQRTSYGTLFSPHRFKTAGRGSGGNGDPLARRGSLTLRQDYQWLFAVNAGSSPDRWLRNQYTFGSMSGRGNGTEGWATQAPGRQGPATDKH